MSKTKKQPIERVNFYPVSAAIWRNENEKGEAFYSVTFNHSFKDKDGNYRNSASFNASELLLVAKAADTAHTKIIELRASDKSVVYE